MYYTPHFPIQTPSTSKALGQRATRTFLYQFASCSRSHFFTSSITSSSLPNLFPRWHIWRLQRGGNWKDQDVGWTVGGEELSIWVLQLLPVFSKVCGSALCWRRTAAVPIGAFKINHRKKIADISFCFLLGIQSVAKHFGQPHRSRVRRLWGWELNITDSVVSSGRL